jgi:hypothetical protein
MTRCKREITRDDPYRKWPHHVALPVGKVRGLVNSEVVRGFADALSVSDRALELLAGGPRGCTKGRLLADGFTADTLADLVGEGLATPQRETP